MRKRSPTLPSMHHPNTLVAIRDSVDFYDRMLLEYAPRTAFNLATVYLVRKSQVLDFKTSERILRCALDARS